jgi:hypothetical protein
LLALLSQLVPAFLLHILARQAHGHNCSTESIRQWKKREMAGLQRSAQTFRRSGSSGLVWDERCLTVEKPCDGGACAVRQPELRHPRSVGMLRRQGRDDGGGVDDKKRREVIKKPNKARKDHQNNQEGRKKGPARKAFRTRDVVPAAEPPSPRVSGCVLCSIFRGEQRGSSSAQRAS